MNNPADYQVMVGEVDLMRMRMPVWLPPSILPDIEDHSSASIMPVWRSYGYGFCEGCDSPVCEVCVMNGPGDCCGLCDTSPPLLCSMTCWDGRTMNSRHYRSYVQTVVTTLDLPCLPCSWCGKGTETWCANCDRTMGPATALCHYCDQSMSACRLCWAVNYIKQRGPPRPPAALRALRRATRVCTLCRQSPATKRCGGCDNMPYCSKACQKTHWKLHKRLCAMLRGPIAVFWIYEWQFARVASCWKWALRKDDEARIRFQSCFAVTDGTEFIYHLAIEVNYIP